MHFVCVRKLLLMFLPSFLLYFLFFHVLIMSEIDNLQNVFQLYPTKDWLVGSSLPSIFSPDVIQSMLDELTTSNVRYVLVLNICTSH